MCVDSGEGASDPFNEDDAVTSRLQQVLFPYPGSVSPLNASRLKFDKLITLQDKPRGTVSYSDLMEPSFFGRGGPRENPSRVPSTDKYVLAARIHGKPPEQAPAALDAAAASFADPSQCDADQKEADPDSKKSADTSDAKADAAGDASAADDKAGKDDKPARSSDEDAAGTGAEQGQVRREETGGRNEVRRRRRPMNRPRST